jgi:hypothetical protein
LVKIVLDGYWRPESDLKFQISNLKRAGFSSTGFSLCSFDFDFTFARRNRNSKEHRLKPVLQKPLSASPQNFRAHSRRAAAHRPQTKSRAAFPARRRSASLRRLPRRPRRRPAAAHGHGRRAKRHRRGRF